MSIKYPDRRELESLAVTLSTDYLGLRERVRWLIASAPKVDLDQELVELHSWAAEDRELAMSLHQTLEAVLEHGGDDAEMEELRPLSAYVNAVAGSCFAIESAKDTAELDTLVQVPDELAENVIAHFGA